MTMRFDRFSKAGSGSVLPSRSLVTAFLTTEAAEDRRGGVGAAVPAIITISLASRPPARPLARLLCDASAASASSAVKRPLPPTSAPKLSQYSKAVLLGALLASGTLLDSPGWANTGGITGVSGKQGTSCSSCHSGGLTPDVRFIGPSTVAPGAMATFRFEVQSMVLNQRRAGFNVASSAGRLDVLPDQGERRTQTNELTHTAPKPNVDMLAGWDFTWTAPDTPAIYTLFGAGNSVNFNGQSNGDRSNTTALDVEVAFDTPTPTVTPQPPTPTITPTRAPVPCVGDCNGSGDVAVNELVTGVNIALGNLAIGTCTDIDANDSGAVEINELIAAVNAALGPCV